MKKLEEKEILEFIENYSVLFVEAFFIKFVNVNNQSKEEIVELINLAKRKLNKNINKKFKEKL